MLLGRSESIVSWVCVCRLSTKGTQSSWPGGRKPAGVRMLGFHRPRCGGRNEKVRDPLCPFRFDRNRLPAVTRSDRVCEMSTVVNTVPPQVSDADGVNARSSVLVRVTSAAPKVGCSITDSLRGWPARALMLFRILPMNSRAGVIDQLTDPFGQSVVRE